MIPRLLLVAGRFYVVPDAALDRRLHSARHSSRKSSRRSSQQHGISTDTPVNVTPHVTECDTSDVSAAVANESTAANGLYCHC